MRAPAGLRRYGLTPDDFAALLAHQGGRCALCDRRFAARRHVVIDHDHRTGHVRGALCSWCNSLLGLVHDNQTWLRSAAHYLDLPPAASVFSTPRRHVDAPPEVTP